VGGDRQRGLPAGVMLFTMKPPVPAFVRCERHFEDAGAGGQNAGFSDGDAGPTVLRILNL
jgi:hypothetical protein